MNITREQLRQGVERASKIKKQQEALAAKTAELEAARLSDREYYGYRRTLSSNYIRRKQHDRRGGGKW